MIALCIYGYCQETFSVIDTDLKEEMSNTKNGEYISINIILKAQYDPKELSIKADIFPTKKSRRDFVVNELKDFSEKSQISVMLSVNILKGMNEIRKISSHWLCNVINCEATVEAINEVSTNPDVLIIGYNKEQKLLLDDEKSSLAVDGGREIAQNVLQVNADDVWALGYTGQGVIVAVIDTGVNYNHLDLADHLWSSDPDYPNHGYDFVNNDNDPKDDHGHGTHCSGTVCGDGTAGSQTGMAPDATLMCIKVLNSNGSGTLNQCISGIEFAIEHEADIFSMSLGFSGGGTISQRIQIRNMMVNALAAGIIGAVAAGNEGSSLSQYPIPNNVGLPGNCPPPWLNPDQTVIGGLSCVVSVGAVDYSDVAAYFTSHGPVTWQAITGYMDYPYNPKIGLIRPDVCAPGVDIKSLDYSGNNGYTTMSGTSMATPCTAGVMALMLSKNNYLIPAEIDEILETTAQKLTSTKSNIYGSGRIDALAAINAFTKGVIVFDSCSINDVHGNGDGLLTPGETVNLNVTLQNIASFPVHNAIVTLTTSSPYVTINDSIAEYGDFAVGQTITVEDAFTILLAKSIPIGKNISFTLKISSDTTFCKYNFKMMTYDYSLDYVSSSVYDAETGNGNGMLDPGETADICVYITNTGNLAAEGIRGQIESLSDYLTIDTSSIVYGTFNLASTKFARFMATLSSSVPNNNYPLPMTLALSDKEGRVTDREFTYINKCNVVFHMHDSGGDGWQGAYLYVHYNDGTPTDTLTMTSGSDYYQTIPINYTTSVSLTWRIGVNDRECSFDIHYESGDFIYSTSYSHLGVFFTWVNDCSGSISHICHSPEGLDASVVGNDVNINWLAPSRENLTSYNVYRNDVLIASDVTVTSFTDVDVPDGIYYYSVEAVYDDGCISEPTDYVSVEVGYETISGDANGDGTVNISDVMTVVSYILSGNPDPFFFNLADVNGDGVIDIMDIMGIIAIIIN